MFIELSKSDYTWLSKFLIRFIELRKTRLLNGMKISDRVMGDFEVMTQLTPIKGGTFIVPITEEEAALIAYLLEDCVACCPGCSLSSVKHRSSVLAKLYQFIEKQEKMFEPKESD